ncbi:ATP-binding protein [Bacillus sp. REN16]|uniref:ATP-binding protein n=1 Tax=Bacillus sp. REN16 TaxID=2887296 RepID=UPI001E3D7F26|nr:ATP-binding protein [Bacillus sp. REN16]MCC3358448.1 sensor histidine kinase [Bacillus sp. REN16]
MTYQNHSSLLVHEEKKALRLYLLLFYSVLVMYDFVYYYLYPMVIHAKLGFPTVLVFWVYIFMIILLPTSYYLKKINKLFAIKYMYVLTYFVITTFDDVITFAERESYISGNAAEVVLLLFSPIFINKRFFLTVSIGITMKYSLIGLLLGNGSVMAPMVLILLLALIAYILLNRFYSYIKALTETHEELRNKEKLAFVGQLATTIGHEIRNPLASLKGFTQLQREKHKEDDLQYSIMEQEIDRIDSILNDLLVIGKPRQIQVAHSNLKEFLEYVISIIEQSEQGKSIEVELKVDDSFPPVECDEKQMKQVFLNLIKNGFESMPEGGKLTIEGSRVADNQVSIRICDEGLGIPKDVQEKLFQPFFTTKDYGTGLGLMVSKKIIEEHHGKIEIESKEGKGTKVEILMPISQ